MQDTMPLSIEHQQAILALGQYFTDRKGNKFVFSCGLKPANWQLLGVTSDDTVFSHYNEKMTIEGLCTSINDHIEEGRLVASNFNAQSTNA